MGIEREYFIFYGVKGDYNQFVDIRGEDEKQWYDCDEGVKNFIITENKEPYKPFALTDGMSGEYSCYGVLYNRYGQDRWGEARSINEFFDDEKINKLKELWVKQQEELKVDIGQLKPALHIVHYYT